MDPDDTGDITAEREAVTLRVPLGLKARLRIDAGVHATSINERIVTLLDAAVPAYEELTSATAAP
jgi:hypothetical protein